MSWAGSNCSTVQTRWDRLQRGALLQHHGVSSASTSGSLAMHLQDAPGPPTSYMELAGVAGAHLAISLMMAHVA
jgi:hypothetical protein